MVAEMFSIGWGKEGKLGGGGVGCWLGRRI